MTFLVLMVTTGLAALFVFRQQTRFIPTLIVGLYIALLFFVNSAHWVWELGESFPVLPVADLIRDNVPPGAAVYIDYDYDRPSLNFYSAHRVQAQTSAELRDLWESSSPAYLVVQDPEPFQAASSQYTELGQTPDWTLIANQP